MIENKNDLERMLGLGLLKGPSEEKKDNFISTLAGLLFMPFAVLFRGYVITYLWLWFVVPLGIFPQIGIAHACGISLVMAFFTYRIIFSEESERKLNLLYEMVAGAFHTLMMWGMAAIIHAFM